MDNRITYDKSLKALARRLRNESTLSEVLLWKRLRGRQIKGLDFHRQKPIDRYIVDFYCSKLKLAVEVDGGSHYENADADKERDDRLAALGIATIRIADSRVKKNIEGVIYEIEQWIDEHAATRHTPSPGATGGHPSC